MYSVRGKTADPSRKVVAEKLRKWNESCWKMVVYICFSTLALVARYV